jgi:hypothetical protein
LFKTVAKRRFHRGMAMKVREVIEQLKMFDPELPVVMDGEEGGITEEQVIIRLISIDRFKNEEECELIGEHEIDKSSKEPHDLAVLFTRQVRNLMMAG